MNEPLEYKTPIPKAAQYADDILAGKITLPSLKGQVPESWIRETKKILEAKGYLIVEDSPDMSQGSVEQSNLSTEQINSQIETAKEAFLNETDQIVEQSSHIGITLPESVIQEAKQEVRFDEQISELKQETVSEFDKISKKEYQWNDTEHIDGIDKYNMMVDIANGAKEGLKDSFSEKINQYVREINNGQSKDKILQGLPQSFIDAVESKISSQSPVQGKTEEQKKVDQIKDFFDLGDMSNIVSAQEQKFQDYADRIKNGEPKEKVLQGLPKSMTDSVERILNSESEIKKVTIEKITGVENMKHMVLEVGKTHYLFTHQTDEGTAKKIFESNFEVSPGTGINSTMTRLGSDMVINQIERQIGGDSHRGYKGMFILAVPKEIIDALPGYDKSDAFEDYLLQSVDYGKDGNPNIVIPDKFNFAYLQGEDLFVNQAFDKEIGTKEIVFEEHNMDELSSISDSSSHELVTLENMEDDPELRKKWEQAIFSEMKKGFPELFRTTYLPELNENQELVPRNPKVWGLPSLPSNSIYAFPNGENITTIKQKVYEQYLLSKESFNESLLIDEFRKLYFERDFSKKIGDEDVKKIQKIADRFLLNNPEFKYYYNRSHRVNPDSFFANADALGDYGRDKGYPDLGVS
jgi:hypothetical protein